MRKISRLKLELAIFAIISMGISLFLGIMINAAVKPDLKSDNEVYNYVYKDYIKDLLSELKKPANINEEKIKSIINREWRRDYTLYLVDKNGRVIESSSGSVKEIDPEYIKDGMVQVKHVDNKEKNKDVTDTTVRVRACYHISSDYFLLFDYLGYGQNDGNFYTVIFSVIAIYLISFSLLTGGRFTYLLKINKSIRVMAEGNLSSIAPVKYKNELTQLAKDINFMAEELQKEDDKRKEFLTNISHDLRTPLTTITGYIKIIKEKKYRDTEEVGKFVDIMERKSNHLKYMIDDFFQYSKLASNDIDMNKEKLYLQELIRQIVVEEQPVFKQSQLELLLYLDNKDIIVFGDGELIFRAVSNLLSNALKYSKKETKVEVVIGKENIDNSSYGVISVISIPKEDIKEEEVIKLFDRLYKKDKARGGEGSGLGLSIVKEIIKLHGGLVMANKEADKIVFKLFIPIVF
ncbi:sensor histidine kinase [Clostridium manihotivorum]|uniref:histidine kinase n=1 Tax=Clostridium manihotivorum TaxID=2320868 RepID=A0A410DTT3_9CLOT|nr:HAMP domain-containing sensor histidine kinase [Clostridium manihotivorum]QAA32496.1 sensor histidine kinase [Clostridium manihotivorum]